VRSRGFPLVRDTSTAVLDALCEAHCASFWKAEYEGL